MKEMAQNMHLAEDPMNQKVSPWSLESGFAYEAWREEKLDNYTQVLTAPPVKVANLANPTASEHAEMVSRCRKTNLSLYETAPDDTDESRIRASLRGFADAMGLQIAESHRSAGEHGIVALKPSNAARQRGYIPYTKRALNWHTDGYYNSPHEQIRAMVLHCVTPAEDGGVNQLLDPEIAYIRLRDHDPALIAALMHPKAMTIPENRETNGQIRPVSSGPVFSIGADGKLVMRYTARTRSIEWRDDATTKRATEVLTSLLQGDEDAILTRRMSAGQGVLCNNVLHNRTGFDPNQDIQSARVLFRVRFHNRIEGS